MTNDELTNKIQDTKDEIMRHLMVPDKVMPDYQSEAKAVEKGFHKHIGKYLEEINTKFE